MSVLSQFFPHIFTGIRGLLFCLLLLLSQFFCFAQTEERYFYKGYEYGSDAMYNPLTVVLNGSYDIIQLDGHSRDIFNFNYADAADNVWYNLKYPFRAINSNGWSRFLRNEILPLEFGKVGAQWWPNYQLHLIGGGMTYRALAEWYSAHNIPAPSVFSAGTLAIYHLLNEIVENENYVGETTDPIADIYVFDIAGALLFSSDAVSNFFSKTLNLRDWSLQPSLNLRDGTLQNNGQYFAIKWKIPLWENERWHAFYYFGMNGLGGASYKLDEEYSVSGGVGLRAKSRYVVVPEGNQQTVDLVWNAGIFYDRNNSLLASLFISGLTDYRVNMNIYPGLLKIGNFSPGLWCVVNQAGKPMIGMTTRWTPGVSWNLQ